jgi:hypothetical protein
MIRARRVRWVGNVACMGEKKNAEGFWWRDLKGRDHLEDMGIDGRIILK